MADVLWWGAVIAASILGGGFILPWMLYTCVKMVVMGFYHGRSEDGRKKRQDKEEVNSTSEG